jgi:hypothetical protein
MALGAGVAIQYGYRAAAIAGEVALATVAVVV